MLAFAFGVTAFLYALVGFAGGSTYLALLSLWQVPTLVIPSLALLCNIAVAGGTSARFAQAGLLRWRLLVPHMVLAIPCAYLGGRITLDKHPYQLLVAACLLAASVHLLRRNRQEEVEEVYAPPPLAIALPAGAVLGFLAGLVGIGGGIFLAPLLYALKAANPREIAATCAWFILLNSLAGLAGQAHKFDDWRILLPYWPLLAAVILGGMFGNHATLRVLSLRHIARATGLMLLAIAGMLLWGVLFGKA